MVSHFATPSYFTVSDFCLCHAPEEDPKFDIADIPSADFVGNNRYVFNIKGNNYRTVVLVVFFAGTVAIRFIGTHYEYDKIKDIKNI